MSKNDYSVTTTTFSGKRYWGVRFDYVGIGYLFSVSVSKAPAMRIIAFGCSLWFGRIPERPTVISMPMAIVD